MADGLLVSEEHFDVLDKCMAAQCMAHVCVCVRLIGFGLLGCEQTAQAKVGLYVFVCVCVRALAMVQLNTATWSHRRSGDCLRIIRGGMNQRVNRDATAEPGCVRR